MVILAPVDGRIDKVLSQALGYSRNQIERLIDAGCVRVEGQSINKSSFKIKSGQEIEYRFLQAKEPESKEVDFDIQILYEDEDILIINKPSNLVVHPAPSVKEATVVDWLMQKGFRLSTIYGEARYGIVHRIDKDTTGALVVAKSNDAHIELSNQLKSREMGRYYLALIDYPLKESISIDKPIARNPKNRLKMGIVSGGKEAKTDFLKIAQAGDIELIGARLHTGRTHQIRVHLHSINRAILGDKLYGYRGRAIDRVFLHAKFLYLNHPRTGERVEVDAPLFPDMENFIRDNFDRRVLDENISGKYLQDSFIDYFDAI